MLNRAVYFWQIAISFKISRVDPRRGLRRRYSALKTLDVDVKLDGRAETLIIREE
jgi:hypothetical protein